MNLIYRQRIDVNDFDDNKIKELAKRISESCSATEAIILIERFMAERLDNSCDYHLKRICTVTNNMLHNPNHDLHELSETACLSSKQFVRVFREEVGASPKVVSRIMRMHKALFLLRRKNLSLIEIAYKCGFSDQAHMNKEFKTFTNCTPLEYLYSYQLDKDPYAEYMFASSDEFKV